MILRTFFMISLLITTPLQAYTVFLMNGSSRDQRIKLVGPLGMWDTPIPALKMVMIQCQGEIMQAEHNNIWHDGHGEGDAYYMILEDFTLIIQVRPRQVYGTCLLEPTPGTCPFNRIER